MRKVQGSKIKNVRSFQGGVKSSPLGNPLKWRHCDGCWVDVKEFDSVEDADAFIKERYDVKIRNDVSMEEYARKMIKSGFPKALVESGVKFVKSGLRDSCICGDDTEAFDLLSSFALACYIEGAREIVSILESSKNGNK